MRYEFVVQGFPLKKDGAQSMWGKPTEARRIRDLRLEALKARGSGPLLSHNITLELSIHIGPVNDKSTGDLDNFITGVCDGLMAADAHAKIAPVFNDPQFVRIDPRRPIVIYDDREILEIRAQKIIGETQQPYYEVMLEGE